MVFQSFNLFNNMSVLENCIIRQTKVLKRNKEEAKGHAVSDKSRHEPVHQCEAASAFSGQKQRVAIARALAMEPEITL